MGKLMCFLGLHKWKLIGVSEYRYNEGNGRFTTLKQVVEKCQRCPKCKKVPRWYKKRFRLLHPYVDWTGWWPVEYHPEFPEYFEKD